MCGSSKVKRVKVGAFHRVVLRGMRVPRAMSVCGGRGVPKKVRPRSVLLRTRRIYEADVGTRTRGFHRVRRRDGGCRTQEVVRPANSRFIIIGPPCPPVSRRRVSHSFSLPCAQLPRPGCGNGHVPTCRVVGFSIGLRHKYFNNYTFYAVSTRRNGFVMDQDGRDVLGRIYRVARVPSFGNGLSSLKNPSTGVCNVGNGGLGTYVTYGEPSYVRPRVYPGLRASRDTLLSVCRTISSLPKVGRDCVNDKIQCSLLLRSTGSREVGTIGTRCAHRLVVHRIDNELGMTPRRASSQILGLVHGPSFKLFKRFGRVFSYVGHRTKLHRRVVPCFVDDRPKYARRSVTRLTMLAGRVSFRLRRVRSFAPAPVAMDARA